MQNERRNTLARISSATLVQSVEQNLVQWVKLKGRLPGVELHCDPDAVWTFSATNKLSNQVCALRFESEAVDSKLDKILERYRRHRAAVNWWVGPSATPHDLSNRLRAHGLSCRNRIPGMAIDLNDIKDTFSDPCGLTLGVIEDFSIFEKFEHPSIGRISTDCCQTQLDDKIRLTQMSPQCVWHFSANLEGEPLGSATVFVGAGVAGVYDVAVVRRARGRGIGTDIVLAALRFARDLGYRDAVLHTSGEAESIYRKIGFQPVCTISQWYYPRSKSFLSR